MLIIPIKKPTFNVGREAKKLVNDVFCWEADHRLMRVILHAGDESFVFVDQYLQLCFIFFVTYDM